MSVEEMTTLVNSPIMRAVFGIREVPTNIPTSAPHHIVAVRTRDAKLAVVLLGSLVAWTSTLRPIESELYDYSSPLGRQEIDNQVGRNAKLAALQALIDHQVLPEVRAPLPASLNNAQEQGLADMRQLAAIRGG